MFIKVYDIVININLIQYIEIKNEAPLSVVIHFNVGSVKRIKFKNIDSLNEFLERFELKD